MAMSLLLRRRKLVAGVWLLFFIVVGTLTLLQRRDAASRDDDISEIVENKAVTDETIELPTQIQNDLNTQTNRSQHETPSEFTERIIEQRLTSSVEPRLIQRQNERRRHLADECLSRLRRQGDRYDDRRLVGSDGRPIPIEFYNLLVDDERKFLYCEIPKVACTNWKRVLVFLSGKLNVSSPEQLTWLQVHGGGSENKLLPQLHRFTPDEIQYRLNTYFKFVFVRHPIDRLLSAYNDKFGSTDNELFNANYGRLIVRKYRRNATAESLRRGHDVRLDEFVRYVLDPATREVEARQPHWYGFEQHWREMDDLCHPCHVGYDFIGKYETLDEDVEHVFKLLGLHGEVEFPGLRTAVGETNGGPKSAAERRKFLRKSFKGVLSAKDVTRLWEIYEDDYRAFDYEYPAFLNV